MMRSLPCLFFLALVLAFSRGALAEPPAKLENVAPLQAHPPAQPAQPPMGQGAAQPIAAPDLTGKVLETIDASTYTYIRLKTAGGERWAAVPHTELKVGQQVTVVNGTSMYGFESKTLGRKFDEIVFGVVASAGMPSAAEQLATMQAAHGQAPLKPGGSEINVERAPGPDGKTVAELFEQKDTLKDSVVSVRAKVVKFSPGIMGKNWLHLQDGTGAQATKTNDVTVKTEDSAMVGDVVMVKGKVQTNVDLGAGYSYPVLIDEATVTKQ